MIVGSGTNLYAVDQTDGKAQWQYTKSSTIETALRVGNTAYIVSDSLTAIDIHTGIERWNAQPAFDVGPHAYAQERIVGQAKAIDSELIVAIDESTGTEDWRQTIEIHETSDQSSLCIANETVYCGIGPLYALNLTDGTIRWSSSLGTTNDELKLVSDGSAVYLTFDGRVLAIDAESGELWWRVDVPAVDTPPALTDDTLYVSLDHGLIALDSETGDERFRITLSETEMVSTAPIVAGGTVYLAVEQTLYALTDQ